MWKNKDKIVWNSWNNELGLTRICNSDNKLTGDIHSFDNRTVTRITKVKFRFGRATKLCRKRLENACMKAPETFIFIKLLKLTNLFELRYFNYTGFNFNILCTVHRAS